MSYNCKFKGISMSNFDWSVFADKIFFKCLVVFIKYITKPVKALKSKNSIRKIQIYFTVFMN